MGFLSFCLKSIVYKPPELKTGWQKHRSQPKGICLLSCARLDTFSISCQRGGMAWGAASESAPAPRRGATHGAYAAAWLASPGRLGARRNPSYTKLSEDAGENSAATSSKGLLLLSAARWEINEAGSVVFISSVLASRFICR